MGTSNPALSDNVYNRAGQVTSGRVMTLDGTVSKVGFLLLLVIGAASWTWRTALTQPDTIGGWILLGIFGGLITAMVTIFKPAWSPVTSPIYAVLEGLALGAISALYNQQYHGIVAQALALTFATLFCMLAAYRLRWIQVTDSFRLGVVAATGGIALVYIVSLGLSFFGIRVPYIHENGLIGIGFSLFVVGVAALNLVLDFDFIDRGARRRLPAYMEWYGAFGLLVTLVWLYLEMLRLLSKLNSRR